MLVSHWKADAVSQACAKMAGWTATRTSSPAQPATTSSPNPGTPRNCYVSCTPCARFRIRSAAGTSWRPSGGHWQGTIECMTHPLPTANRAWTIAAVSYASPDARGLTQALHQEQMATYGRADDPEATEAAEFQPPRGVFLLATHADGTAAACGGWRTVGPSRAEIKRMYVAPAARGHGLGRQILEALEGDARRHGMNEAILETGVNNSAALALYTRCGYTLVPPYAAGRDPRINRALSKPLGQSDEGRRPDGADGP
jgi:GNAT superfamily N-acetyltransferase